MSFLNNLNNVSRFSYETILRQISNRLTSHPLKEMGLRRLEKKHRLFTH